MKNITQRSLLALTPPLAGCNYQWDGSVCGFGARITPNKALAYVLRYVINGRQRIITLGRFSDLSLDDARSKAIKLRCEIINGRDPLAERKINYEIPTIRGYVEHYIDAYAKPNKRLGSVEKDRRFFQRFILSTWGNLKINAIQKRDVLTLHSSLCKTPYHANRLLALLSKFFNLSIDEGYRPDNPVKGIKHYPEQPRQRWLSNEEIGRLAEALRTEKNKVAGLAILFLLATGARKGEALNATWDQFHLGEKLWIKPASSTKQKKNHIVELNAFAMTILLELEKDNPSPYVFYYPRYGKCPKDLSKFWWKVCEKANLPDVRMHDLRHTFASHIINAGYSLEVVGELLGHNNLSTTKRYAHLQNSLKREVVESIGKSLEASTQPKLLP